MEKLSLTDNLCALPGCKAQHGLSLYIKTKKHKILFDLGQDGTFIRNAQKLGVDIADIDTGYFAAEKLSERHRELNLIMISDSEQYAIDAFRLHVSDFWLYPYTAERVEEAFHNLRHTPEKRSQLSITKNENKCFLKKEYFYSKS